ncbi:MAG: arginine--tRNA ligase [Elusimicrobia bacterium]|nr:arginine--tRNA ligase [Elusimicrobiota bacterium]
MILERVKRDASERIRAWAAGRGIEPAPAPVFNPPPGHVPADLSVPWPLGAAKLLKRKPLEIAGELAADLGGVPGVENAAASAPGFVNLRLKADALAENLRAILREPSAYGASLAEKRRSILIEYVSANPTGPLHLASGRAATLGDSLVRIFRRLGHAMWAEYYVNDAGGRAEKLGLSLRARYEEAQGRPSAVPEDGYHGAYLKDVAAALPSEAAGWTPEQFGRHAMRVLLETHKEDMAAFGARFDRWFLESELYASKAVERTLEYLRGRGMVYDKEGAVWLGTQAVAGAEDDKDRVLVKSTGTPTYFLPDIAYHKDKFDRGFSELIDIWGADHHGYVPRMKAAIAALGKPVEAFHPIVHQLVHLFRGAEAVKMSKRAGEFVSLREVMQEVGRDACRFFFALRTANSHMNFDLELAKKQSSENPVYYVQYVHARICSIFREAEKTLGASAAADGALLEAQVSRLATAEERALLVKLAWFPATLQACEAELSPHPLAGYLMDLAGLYHPFYEKCRVVDAGDPDTTRARLALCGGVRAVIAQGLDLLGVSAPEKM